MPIGPGPGQVPLESRLGPVQRATKQVAPISGGTLAIGARQGHGVAVASDPEHDRIWLVEATTPPVAVALDLPAGAEPGRVVTAGSRAYVGLRRSGEVAVIDLEAGQLLSRVNVCPSPRGLAVDAASDTLAVACASGELVLRKASTMEAVTTYHLGADLRDVVMQGDEMLVSRFRSAELVAIDRKTGAVVDQAAPEAQDAQTPEIAMPASVAWRMVMGPGGQPVVLHQRHAAREIVVSQPGGYGGGGFPCGAIVQAAVSQVGAGSIRSTGGLGAGLAVDVAVRSDGAVVMAVPQVSPVSALMGVPMTGDSGANGGNGTSGVDDVKAGFPADPSTIDGFIGNGSAMPCGADSVRSFKFEGGSTQNKASSQLMFPSVVNAVAVSFDAADHLVMQTRAPGGIWWNGRFTAFGGDREVVDTGHQIFHMDAGSGLACASCHPEGGEDGRVWKFETFGPRRTQPLQGGMRGTEPFHWSGDVLDVANLMDTVFTGRMGGGKASADQADALIGWLDRVPFLPPATPADPAAVARGQALYESSAVGCTDCHQGPRMALAGSFDVGTGSAMQVPPLRGVAYRAPFLHDGRAKTLADRFGSGGGGDKHGHTSQLSKSQIADLVSYLESL